MKSLGKGLQVFGLVLLPLGCLLDFQNGGEWGRNYLAYMLLMMITGVIAFILGRYVEGYAR